MTSETLPSQPSDSRHHDEKEDRSQSMSRYPCGTCDRPVTWDQQGVACEGCGQWFHTSCQSLNSASYDNLCDPENKNVVWKCVICDCANYSSTTYDLFGIEKSAHASDLQDKSDTESFSPLHTSTPTRATRQSKQQNRPLRFLNINCQSITGKVPALQNLLLSTKPDVVIATETWLDKDVKSSELFPQNYEVFRADRNRDGGGVLVAVSKTLTCHEIPELTVPGCEIIWVKIKLKGTRQLLVASYYKHDTSDADSQDRFEISARRAVATGAHIIIGGDFNFPAMDWVNVRLKFTSRYPTLHHKFIDTIQDLGLEQMVTFPTRGDNTLDLLLTNHPSMVPRVESMPGLSDHDIPYMEFQTHPVHQKQTRRPVPQYNKADWPNLRQAIKQLSDDIVTKYSEKSDPEEVWTELKEKLHSATETHIPTTTLRPKNSKPWVDYNTKKLIRRRDRLYKRWKKTGDEKIRCELRDLKRQVQRRLRRAYWSYTENLITDSHESKPGTKKSFWTYIKSQRTEAASVSPLKVDGKLVTEAKDKAEVLNAQFQSAFSSKLSCSPQEFENWTGMSPEPEGPTCDYIHISVAGVRKLLKGLNPTKAPGPDEITPRLLKEIADEIAPALTLLFQSSINTGIVPKDWKKANVSPVFKKGERYRPENYRPISLTSVPCKILEHIVVSTIMGFVETNNILREEQHGFRRGRSCESQLLGLVDELSYNMEKGKQSDVLVMDFSKAFDKVCHSLLIHKLRHYGITGQVHEWIKNFLANRQQAVVVEGASSKAVPVESGVPQGSVLGPSLFLLYINDLPKQLSSTTRLFADDTLCHRTMTSPKDQKKLQQDLDHMADWETKWKMSFHPDKCQALHISRKRNTLTGTYHLHGQNLKTVEETKYLGVTITQDLSWDTHISNTTNRANKTLGFLRRNLRVGSINIKETAYKALVRPILEYASSVWDPYTIKNTNNIEKIQRRAARWVVNRHRHTSSVESMLTHLQWSTLAERRRAARLTTFFKYHREEVSINTPFRPTPNPPSRSTRQSHRETYLLPACKTNYRKYSFFPRTIRDWNNLPPEVISSTSAECFRSQI